MTKLDKALDKAYEQGYEDGWNNAIESSLAYLQALVGRATKPN